MPRAALVVRFPPATAENVLKRAERSSRVADGHHLTSVFAATAQPGEDEDALLARVLRATETDFPLQNNPKVFVCTEAAELLDRGFTFVKDGYEGEIEEHFSIDLGASPTLEDAQRFLDAFERRRR